MTAALLALATLVPSATAEEADITWLEDGHHVVLTRAIKADDLIPFYNSEGKFGCLDQSGKSVIEPQYEDGGVFSEGFAWILKDGLCGYINTKGEVVVEPIYNAGANFNDGYTYIDSTGKELTSDLFQSASFSAAILLPSN